MGGRAEGQRQGGDDGGGRERMLHELLQVCRRQWRDSGCGSEFALRSVDTPASEQRPTAGHLSLVSARTDCAFIVDVDIGNFQK